MSRRRLCWALALLLAACGGSGNPSPTASPVATVAGVTIGSDLFDARLHSAETAVAQGGGANSNAAQETQLRASVLRSLIIDTVIALEAQREGVAASDADVNSEFASDQQAAGGSDQLETQLAAAGGSDLQLRDEIRSQLNEQRLEDHDAGLRAQQVVRQLAAGGDFASLAQQYSDDADSSAKGGSIGEMTVTQIQGGDPAFAKAALALQPGQTSTTAVRDQQGYDIIRVDAATAMSRTLRRILVAAPQPYTVKERPDWFQEAIFAAVAGYCEHSQVSVYISDAGGNPCTALTSSPTPSPPAATATP